MRWLSVVSNFVDLLLELNKDGGVKIWIMIDQFQIFQSNRLTRPQNF